MYRLLARCILVLLLGTAPAAANVLITFYSHPSGIKWSLLHTTYVFPHAYITAKGTLSDGETVDTDFGFGSLDLDPRAYLGPVTGEVYVHNTSKQYLEESVKHLSLIVDDVGYRKILDVVAEWQKDPVYEIDMHNCVTFVGEIAQRLGLKISMDPKFDRDPAEFLADVAAENPYLNH